MSGVRFGHGGRRLCECLFVCLFVCFACVLACFIRFRVLGAGGRQVCVLVVSAEVCGTEVCLVSRLVRGWVCSFVFLVCASFVVGASRLQVSVLRGLISAVRCLSWLVSVVRGGFGSCACVCICKPRAA